MINDCDFWITTFFLSAVLQRFRAACQVNYLYCDQLLLSVDLLHLLFQSK